MSQDNLPAVQPIELVPVTYTKIDVLEKDVQTVRDSLISTIAESQKGFKELMNLAIQSQNHNVYKAAAEFLNATVLAQKTLADVTFKRKEEITQQANNTLAGGPQVVHNTLITTMTTQQAMDMARNMLRDVDAEDREAS